MEATHTHAGQPKPLLMRDTLTADELADLAKAAGYQGELLQCQELDSAVQLAAAAVQRQGASALLLSPACASFDQYRDFEARGDHFRALVQPLLDPG